MQRIKSSGFDPRAEPVLSLLPLVCTRCRLRSHHFCGCGHVEKQFALLARHSFSTSIAATPLIWSNAEAEAPDKSEAMRRRRFVVRALLIGIALIAGGSFLLGWASIRTLDRAHSEHSRDEHSREDTLPTVKTLPRRELNDVCDVTDPELAEDWPSCADKMRWFEEHWQSHQCYADHGVDGTPCSFRKYLSSVEDHCPPFQPTRGRNTMVPNKEIATRPNFNITALFARFVDNQGNYGFIKQRITRMWKSWVEAYERNREEHAKAMYGRTKKTIMLHLGFLSKASGSKFADMSSKGGPLGELVQWSDLLASLHILGHDLIVSTENPTLFQTIDHRIRPIPCPQKGDVDLIFTDIMGLRALRRRKEFLTNNRCKFRLLDSFGTHAQFNTRDYFDAHKDELGGSKKNPWGGHGFDLRQFLTLYPHTPDNTFLGFVVNTNNVSMGHARKGVLVYGKERYMWDSAADIVRIAMNVTGEVHATVADTVASEGLPAGVINHGLLDEVAFHELLSKVKFFLGLGFPFEGPAPLEAIAHGAIFINPAFTTPKGRLTDKFFADKPTLRALTSQCPYLEEVVGEPWVHTVNTADESAFRRALSSALDVDAKLPQELTSKGMLIRVSTIVDKLDTCSSASRWPPRNAMRVEVSRESESCEAACAREKLRCEPAFFPRINTEKMLKDHFGCTDPPISPSIVAPGRCARQELPLLYSCSASVKKAVRLCPCRTFLPEQRQLCDECI